MKIKNVRADKILNSAGEFSLRTTVDTEKGSFTASIPKGTSRGKHEKEKFSGGIDIAISRINSIIKKKIMNIDFKILKDILKLEDYTTVYGGDVCLVLTYALIRALACHKEMEIYQIFSERKKIPLILSKIIGGGLHASGPAPEFQEFLVMSESNSLMANIKNNLSVHKKVKEKFQDKNTLGKDLEGGWVLPIDNEQALAALKSETKSKIGVDIAASTFFNNKNYSYKDKKLTREEQIDYIKKLIKKFKLYYIEGPLEQEDFEGYTELTQIKNVLIVGDDLFVTDPERLKKGISLGACNACIVKPDQIGSLKKTIAFVDLAKKNKLTPIISHRSGETNDTMIADLAVGLHIPIMKIGIHGGERVAKINRLLEIENGNKD